MTDAPFTRRQALQTVAATTSTALFGTEAQSARIGGGPGVGPETPVGISAERSFEMIVGLLGILKAGGVYVPLDLDDHRERLLSAVEDAGIRIILTRERQLFFLSERGVRVRFRAATAGRR